MSLEPNREKSLQCTVVLVGSKPYLMIWLISLFMTEKTFYSKQYKFVNEDFSVQTFNTTTIYSLPIHK
jgi:hypothetical protein